jgi:hypothetical protein
MAMNLSDAPGNPIKYSFSSVRSHRRGLPIILPTKTKKLPVESSDGKVPFSLQKLKLMMSQNLVSTISQVLQSDTDMMGQQTKVSILSPQQPFLGSRSPRSFAVALR